MPIVIASVLIFLVLCLCSFLIWEAVQRRKAEEKIPLHDLLKLIHTNAKTGANKTITTNKVSKVWLMEETNLKPRELKTLLGMMKEKCLVDAKQSFVTITSFGCEYFKNFGEKNGKTKFD